ncbi:MAG: Gly-zipper Omp protein [Campylobacterota bacterium]|nr:Gly-zipper Omp protein [Campylobacterota bacterium]
MKKLNIKHILVLGGAAVLISGCAQVGPSTKKGALIGAGTGAVVSGVTGHNVLKGAAIGTAVGAGIGYLEDEKR